jgi:hypothetical protein
LFCSLLFFDLFERNVFFVFFVAVNFPAITAFSKSKTTVIASSITGNCKKVSAVFTVVLSSVQLFWAEGFSQWPVKYVAGTPKTDYAQDNPGPFAPFVGFFGESVSFMIAYPTHDQKLAVLFSFYLF